MAEKAAAFIMLVPSAFMQSMSAFVAQNIGAYKLDRAKKALWCGIGASLVAGVVMGYITFFHGDMLANSFAKDAEIIFLLYFSSAQSYISSITMAAEEGLYYWQSESLR